MYRFFFYPFLFILFIFITIVSSTVLKKSITSSSYSCRGSHVGLPGFNNSFFPSISSDIGSVCKEQQLFSCCTIEHASVLQFWHLACEDSEKKNHGMIDTFTTLSEETCCNSLRNLRCYACDGYRTLGHDIPICTSYAVKTFHACSNIFLDITDDNPWLHPCNENSLICSQWYDVFSNASMMIQSLGFRIESEDENSNTCWNGISSRPFNMSEFIMAANAEGLFPITSTLKRTNMQKQDTFTSLDDDINDGSTSIRFGWIRKTIHLALYPFFGEKISFTLAHRFDVILLIIILILLLLNHTLLSRQILTNPDATTLNSNNTIPPVTDTVESDPTLMSTKNTNNLSENEIRALRILRLRKTDSAL